MLQLVGVLSDLIAGPGVIQVAETAGVVAQCFARLLAILIAVHVGLVLIPDPLQDQKPW